MPLLSVLARTNLQTSTLISAIDVSRSFGDFGVELEIEGVMLPRDVPGWVCHTEGSLQGEAVEYVTNGAVTRTTLETSLRFLNSAFAANRSDVRNSYRAGTHIHYNMQTRTFDQIFRSIILYVMVEPLFLKLCGAERDGNLFCMSAYDTGDFHLWLARYYDYIRSRGNLTRQLPRGKYSSLNTDSLVRFGTLECRAFPCAWHTAVVLDFADLLSAILGREQEHPDQMITKVNSETDNFLREIFGARTLPENRYSLLGFGVEQAWPMAEVYREYMGET